jgi:hypothetical protein
MNSKHITANEASNALEIIYQGHEYCEDFENEYDVVTTFIKQCSWRIGTPPDIEEHPDKHSLVVYTFEHVKEVWNAGYVRKNWKNVYAWMPIPPLRPIQNGDNNE